MKCRLDFSLASLSKADININRTKDRSLELTSEEHALVIKSLERFRAYLLKECATADTFKKMQFEMKIKIIDENLEVIRGNIDFKFNKRRVKIV